MQSKAKKAVQNTFILYAKVLLSLIISLVTTRIVLLSLGEADFGLYNLIAGMVSMLAFVNISMTTSTLRYNAYYLNRPEAKEVFNNSVVLHILIAIIIFIFLEIIGIFLISDILNIDHDKIGLAKIIFQFVIFGCITQIITVPYDSLINAHQNMLTYSLIAIGESLLKLIGASALFLIHSDKLVFYSLYISIIPLFVFLSKLFYCKKYYSTETSNFSVHISDKKKFAEMGKFAFWNMFGAFSNTAKNQGVAMVLNVFYGVIVNAAYGISQQINSLCLVLSGSLQKSLNPIILSSAGEGDRLTMKKYAFAQCRLSIFLVSILVVPIFFSLPMFLKIWLTNIPQYTIGLARLLIILTIFQQMTTGIQVAIQSFGKIRAYQITMSILIFMNIPFDILFLSRGHEPDIVFKVAIAVEICCIAVRLIFANKFLSFKFKEYLSEVLLPFTTILLSFLIAACIGYFFPSYNLLFELLKSLLILISTSLIIWFFGVKDQEREIFMGIIKKITKR